MLRMTKQRAIILEELRKARTHPTADEIYSRVRLRLPRISLGTVYRNLDTLSKAGLIARLQCGGVAKRYDGCIESHCHVRCEVCGRVEDMDIAPSADLERNLSDKTSYRITGHRIEFTGVCPECDNAVASPNYGKGG
jgi:Fur family ferric uptake transcriptional regulator